MKEALILVDIQNDFLPGGALAVAEGDQIIPIVNRLVDRFDHVVATQDWHPQDHASFAANHPGKRVGDVIDLHGLRQILWPVHCVQETPGAAFSPMLRIDRIAHVVRKGTDPAIDSYSGFFDNGRRKSTGLADHLKQQGITTIYLAGLATDYCVKFTALDGVREGFTVHLIHDACRGVNLHPGDVNKAIEEMNGASVTMTTSERVLG